MWKKTERAIHEDQVEIAKRIVELGKNLTKIRLKVLRIADKDGWDNALAYLSDELASGSEDEKRLKKARRESGNKRTSDHEKGRL